MNSLQNLARKMGPGLLFAGAAIGVSHLVQSTRAGAEFGWYLVWAVVAANLFKYPFFEFGPRYALATGESLLQGYKRLGTWVLILFLVVTLLTVFTIQAAVTVVTAAIAQFMLPVGEGAFWWSVIILGISAAILAIGKYALLDRAIKWIIVILSASTLAALAAALNVEPVQTLVALPQFDWSNYSNIALLIGLMGWMPAPIDLSVWHSVWVLEKRKICPDLTNGDCLFDFNAGYIGAALLALVFLVLGVLMMYQQGAAFPPQPAAFANTLITMYTNSLGTWAKWLIAVAALSTMFSTTITCLDAIPRILSKTTTLLRSTVVDDKTPDKLYWLFLGVLVAGALTLISVFAKSMVGLVQLATVLSFLTAPFFAVVNYRLITGRHVPEALKPGTPLRILSWLGMAFLLLFGAGYVYTLV